MTRKYNLQPTLAPKTPCVGRCYVMKRDKIKADKRLDRMVSNWKKKRRYISNICICIKETKIKLVLAARSSQQYHPLSYSQWCKSYVSLLPRFESFCKFAWSFESSAGKIFWSLSKCSLPSFHWVYESNIPIYWKKFANHGVVGFGLWDYQIWNLIKTIFLKDK